jgi:hypothetical protein
MEKILEKLFDIRRIPSKFIFVIWLSCALILFAPETFLRKLNLNDFLKDFGKYIGISFVLTSAFLFVTFFNFVNKLIVRKRVTKKLKERVLREIQNLDSHEKALLREFSIQGKTTLQLPLDNDTVVGLLNKGILYQASSTGFTYTHGVYFPYSISATAFDNLTLQLLELPENPTDDDMHRILNERPSWAKEKSRIEDRRNSWWL